MSARPAAGAVAAFDVAAVRREFPVLRETVHGKPLVYLDSAASAQKPQAVIDAESAFYERSYSNIHRGVHHLSMLATDRLRGRARARCSASWAPRRAARSCSSAAPPRR